MEFFISHNVFMIASAISFGLAAFNVSLGSKVNFGLLGMALLVMGLLVK